MWAAGGPSEPVQIYAETPLVPTAVLIPLSRDTVAQGPALALLDRSQDTKPGLITLSH